uniref:Uncharacterized protein n=1 Tax=Rhizophora mucronata TaxID=61149 RepID=A0A2P2R549_RHIMU
MPPLTFTCIISSSLFFEVLNSGSKLLCDSATSTL